MARDRTHKFQEKQRQSAEEKRKAQWNDILEQMEKMPSKYSIGSITSTNTSASPKFTKFTGTGGSISTGTWSVPITKWDLNWEPMTSDGTGYNPHEECTPKRDYDDLREALIALLLRDHNGVIEFPQEMLDEIQDWKVIVDDNEKSLRIVAIPPEVHINGNVPF